MARLGVAEILVMGISVLMALSMFKSVVVAEAVFRGFLVILLIYILFIINIARKPTINKKRKYVVVIMLSAPLLFVLVWMYIFTSHLGE